jgi:hypothetical protein
LAGTIVANVIEKNQSYSQGSAVSALMVQPQSIQPVVFRNLPVPLRMMTAFHCYSTALASIEKCQPGSVLKQFNLREKTIERAIIGLALAQSGNGSVENWLVHLSKDSDWVVRVFAYEGLVVLADVLGNPPGNAQIAALSDGDARVSGAAASVMVNTRNPFYPPYLFSLTNSSSEKHREAVVGCIAMLAKNGDLQAKSVLSRMANNDSNKGIRQYASQLIRAV